MPRSLNYPYLSFFIMVRQFSYIADCYTFFNVFRWSELNSILVVHAHRFKSFLVTMQFLIMQGIISEKVFNFGDCIKDINHINVFLHNLWLIPMMLVICFSIVVKLPQIIFLKNNLHNKQITTAKIQQIFEIFAFFANF